MKRLITFLLTTPLFAEPGDHVYQKGFLSQEEARQSIELQDGYSLDLVLSDPDIHEPVAMAWDGNGALAKGKGNSALTEISLPSTETKFVRITHTGKHRLFWSIHELNVHGKEL